MVESVTAYLDRKIRLAIIGRSRTIRRISSVTVLCRNGLKVSYVTIVLGCLLFSPGSATAGDPGVYALTLNGLEIGLDQQTGSLLSLSYPDTGIILKTSPQTGGLLDMAYPVDSFLPMRLASRFSRASFIKEADGVTIRWTQLGPSRSRFVLPPGEVKAAVTVRAAPDKRSVILTCRIENGSSIPIPQVMFPDLWGLKPLDGIKGTQLRLARGVAQPFQELSQPSGSATMYAGLGWKEYVSQGFYGQHALRWLDYGSEKGGMSIFQKKWASGNIPTVHTYRSETDPMSLRLLWEHKTTIQPGESWESGEFWLTPHPGGWAKGIEVYRNYVQQVNPPRALPRHIRDGLGFQTIFMAEPGDPDPAKIAFRFKDLSRIAQDALQYGINEVVPWFWCTYFTLPMPIRPELGTLEDFVGGVQQARELGVNVTPFVSVRIINNLSAARYGKPGDENHTYHTDVIPGYRPYYVKFPDMVGAVVDSANKRWQEDALADFKAWIDRGVTSFCFDVFTWKRVEGGVPDLLALSQKVRDLARAKDPQSVFSGESTVPESLEYDGSVLDYTWNWVDYVDAAPILNVLRAPRLNCNVESSPMVVKKAFCDGLYLNVMPKHPDRPNGTKLISEEPVLAAALKEVAHLRKQFLPFFVEGTFIGDSVLSRPTPAFVRGYQLGNRLLILVLNDNFRSQQVSVHTDIQMGVGFTFASEDLSSQVVVHSDLALWLPDTRAYKVNSYDSKGNLLDTGRGWGRSWFGVTRPLQPLDMVVFEIEAL